MNFDPVQLLLADDDQDDCLLFREALEELPLSTDLTTVNDGAQLMDLLSHKKDQLPSVLFLDLNMPRKNGLECLTEIKHDEKFKALPVVIYSTSFDPEMISTLYNRGAQHYIRKPAEFSKLKKVIHDAILRVTRTTIQPPEEKFILQP